jgi:polar amino acid transport system permease protein
MTGYRWDFSIFGEYWEIILKGILVSVGYCVGTILIGLVLGLVCGLILLSKRRLLIIPIRSYVEAFRCTPHLVQLIWIYYALPVLINVDIPNYFAAALALSLYIGSFYTEIFRGGVQSIEKGQWDAGRALGMRKHQLMKRIILPQAIKRMVPPFINQSIIQFKNTSLISVIAVGDLLYQGNIITSATYRPLEVYTLIAILYFSILYPMTVIAKRLEVRLAISD